MISRTLLYAAACAMLLAAACVTTQQVGVRFCDTGSFLVDANFDAASLGSCHATGRNSMVVQIRPESDPPINQSPWYAFRLSPRERGTAQIVLLFENGYARYWPKVSTDRAHWSALPVSDVRIADDGRSMTINLGIDEQPVFVAAQELLGTVYYEGWLTQLAVRDDVDVRTIGHSVDGRSILAAMTERRARSVILLGRQHPPEVSGALALRAFVDAVLGNTPVARDFRSRYSVILVPFINPDGVARGHWRLNSNGVDLNRDWGPFSQPETASIARWFATIEKEGTEFHLMLDFHSTRESTLYTQLPGETGSGADFASTWLARVRKRYPDYPFRHDPRARSGETNSKNYFFDTYAIPSMTFEVADEVDRDALAAAMPVFAEEMMRLLLEAE